MVVLGVAGIAVGIVNTLAGGGSVISLSLLMFFGLDANVANGTNRIAIVFQTAAGIKKFSDSKKLDLPKGWQFAVPALIGSLAGAWIATDINKQLFEYLLLTVMVLMVVLMFINPDQWLEGNLSRQGRQSRWLTGAIYLAIGFYGGFVQVGIGYFLLAALVLQSGYDLVRANALKVFITFLYAPFALLIFVWHNQVDWVFGLVLAAGTFAGGWIGARMAVKKGAAFIRWVIVAIVALTVIKTIF